MDDSVSGQDVVELASENDVGARGAFEVFLMEALLKLFHKDAFTVDIDQTMTQATTGHFQGKAPHFQR